MSKVDDSIKWSNLKFGIGVMFYNEKDALPGLIDNLTKFGVQATEVVFFDGPFKGFPNKSEKSDDGSREIIEKWGAQIYDSGEGSHLDKQNDRFTFMGTQCDVLFKIDCDDRVFGDWNLFRKVAKTFIMKTGRQMFNVNWFDLDGLYSDRSTSPRIFHEPGMFETRVAHWMFYYKNKRAQAPFTIGGIQMFHKGSIRSEEREKQMAIYQAYQMDHEAKDIADFQKTQESYNDIIIKVKKTGELDIVRPFKKMDCGCTFGYVVYEEPNKTLRLHDVTKVCGRHIVKELKA